MDQGEMGEGFHIDLEGCCILEEGPVGMSVVADPS